MLSSTLVVASLLALTPLALAVPTPLIDSFDPSIIEVGGGGGGIDGGLYGGGGASLYGGGLVGGGGRRIAATRFRNNKNKALLAAERNNHLNLDKDTELAAKNYREANLDLSKLRQTQDSKLNKAQLAAIAKEQALKKNVNLGGGLWKRQYDEAGEPGGLDIGSDDSFDSPDSIDSDSSSSPLIGSDAAVDQDGLGFGGGFGGLYGGGLSGGLSGGGEGGLGGIGGIDILDNNEANSNENDVGLSSIGDNSCATASPEFDQFGADDVPRRRKSIDPPVILSKRSFVGGDSFVVPQPRLRKTLASKNAKILKLVALENARRRKALNRARVKFNTKKFNELKFKNDVHLNKDNKAEVVALKDRKNLAEAKSSKIGGGFF
ncbi:uncharacterized protein JCM6883_005041 [Sporobolomyces salmoneus]|uniref:uncharacterized protein n=1 Tax=Sporobolomyces salmoneus TaxID=183962 RepID=UPI003181027B